MKAATLFEIICAAHYTYLVDGDFDARGGMLLVAPPEQLKTTFVQILENYPNALVLTDVVTRDIAKIRDQISSGRYTTLGLPEMQKLYNRDADTASNIEGNIRALMEEGFSYVPGGAPDMRVAKAKALIVAGCTTSLYGLRYKDWQNTGFMRRFLVCLYRMKEPFILAQAVENWEKVEIDGGFAWSVPTGIRIPHMISKEEGKEITKWCRWQDGLVDPASLLHRIWSVLRWRKKRLKKEDDSLAVMKDFSECLSKNGAEVEL